MLTKSKKTRELIKEKAYKLFARKGFKEVTMKDVCIETGLSRGGLYRHFNSTSAIFEAIFLELSANARDEFEEGMNAGEDARIMLKYLLERRQAEMLERDRSLSLAMYEYSQAVSNTFFVELNKKGKERWMRFIRYGIERGEFRKVDESRVTDLILYSYQGVRMWSVVIPMEIDVSSHIVESIWEMLVGIAWG